MSVPTGPAGAGSAEEALPERRIGSLQGTPGETLIVIAGLHGNEPAGVRAAERVLARLGPLQPALRGRFVALRGNRHALARGVRFVDRDLNRGWSEEKLASLGTSASRPHAATNPAGSDTSALPVLVEDQEQFELWQAIAAALPEDKGTATFLDLHSTSAEGVPFSMIGDDALQARFAMRFPLTVVAGLLGQVNGVLLEYLRGKGFMSLGIEGGQSDHPESAEHHEAMLWLAIETLGLLPADRIPDLERHRERLVRARDDLPRLVAIHRRYAIVPEDRFRMEPGFASLERVREGQLLARDRHGEIRAPETGVLLLPLYQAQGDDGFFLGREVVA